MGNNTTYVNKNDKKLKTSIKVLVNQPVTEEEKEKYYTAKLYRYRAKVMQNIPNKPYIPNPNEPIICIESHQRKVSCIRILKDGRLASSSSDATLIIYTINFPQYKLDMTLTGHTDKIYHFIELEDGNLVSCSYDMTMRIWKIYKNTFECLAILTKHKKQVFFMVTLNDNRFASGSADFTIKLWSSIAPYDCLYTFIGHEGRVSRMLKLMNRNTMVSTAEDHTLRWWNINTFQIECVNTDFFYSPCLYQIEEKRIFVGGCNRITIVDTMNHQIICIIYDNDFIWVNSMILLKNNEIIFGTTHRALFILDTNLMIYNPYRKEAHNLTVECVIKYNDTCFISCSKDNTIRFWKR